MNKEVSRATTVCEKDTLITLMVEREEKLVKVKPTSKAAQNPETYRN